jgi:hypothetical protein
MRVCACVSIDGGRRRRGGKEVGHTRLCACVCVCECVCVFGLGQHDRHADRVFKNRKTVCVCVIECACVRVEERESARKCACVYV